MFTVCFDSSAKGVSLTTLRLGLHCAHFFHAPSAPGTPHPARPAIFFLRGDLFTTPRYSCLFGAPSSLSATCPSLSPSPMMMGRRMLPLSWPLCQADKRSCDGRPPAMLPSCLLT